MSGQWLWLMDPFCSKAQRPSPTPTPSLLLEGMTGALPATPGMSCGRARMAGGRPGRGEIRRRSSQSHRRRTQGCEVGIGLADQTGTILHYTRSTDAKHSPFMKRVMTTVQL